MHLAKRLCRATAMTSLLIGAGCGDPHASIGRNASAGASAGASAIDDNASSHTGGASGSSSNGRDNAFGEIGRDPTSAVYSRPTAPAPTATEGSCDTVSLTGTLDAAPIDQLYTRGALAIGSVGDDLVSDWSIAASFGINGDAEVAGTASGASSVDTVGTGILMRAQRGEVILPMDLARAKSYACVTGESSLERATNHFILRFAGVGFLTDCASGIPVDGTIEFCNGSACPNDLLGNIDGKSYDASLTSYKSEGQALEVDTEMLSFRTTYVATSAATAMLRYSWLVDRATGNVYCAGNGSYADANVVVDASGTRSYLRQYHFQDLRSVGNCSHASGLDSLEIRVCMLEGPQRPRP